MTHHADSPPPVPFQGPWRVLTILTRQPGPSGPREPADVALEDWDTLFQAVMTRLGQIADAQQIDLHAQRPEDAGKLVAQYLNECILTLDQLRETALHALNMRGNSFRKDAPEA